VLASRLVSDSRELLARLAAREASAWPEFLREYAAVLLQVAREAERDPDAVGDAFLFICEHLRADDGRRLRQWSPTTTGASFETWLRVVAWNLARDARRHRRGRFRPLAAIRRLPLLLQRLYRLRHEEGLTSDQAFAMLQPEFPGLSRSAAHLAEAQVERALGSRERFVLSTRHPVVESLDASEEESPAPTPSDSAPDPESTAIRRDEFERLRRGLDLLPPEDRLLVQLRFEQDLTLSRIASMLGFKDAWAAQRQIDRVVKQLRAALGANQARRSV
jgi:RNA polymerase sigma factor (sigma-70 family)